MSQNVIILLLVLAAALVFAGITLIAVKRAGKKASDAAVFEKVITGLGYAQAIAVAIAPFLPGITGEIITKVLTYAQRAVTRVEATYKAALVAGNATTDMRAQEATSLIKSALALDGISETEQINKLINTVIPLLVLPLPKTHTNTATAQPASSESGAVAPSTNGAV